MKAPVTFSCLALCTLLAACGGGGNGVSPSSPQIPARPIGQTLPPNPSFEVAASATSDNWPTYAHDTFRTGFEPNASQITQQSVSRLQLKWSYQSGAVFNASPILYNGLLYVVDENGQLTALDAQTGAVHWQKQMGNWVEMTPAIYDGTLFIGQHDYPSQLTALDPSNGNQLWTQRLPGGLQGSPLALNGVLYVGVSLGDDGFCHAGGVYTFDERSGSPLSVWLTDPDPQGDGGGVWGPLSYDGQRILYGTGNTCKNAPVTANSIVAVGADMSDQWHIETATANHDDDVGSGVLVLGSNGYAMAKNGSLYAIDLPSGNMLWKQALGAADELGGHSTPAYTESTLIVSGGFGSFPTNNGPPPGGTLYGLGVDGTTKWKMSMGWPIASYVATTPDLAFATIDNSIVALEPASGRELWSYQTAGDFHGGPVISADKVFVADLSGKVYAFGLGTSAAASVRHTLHVTHPIGARPTLPAYCRL